MLTLVRKYRGDVDTLKEEISKVCGGGTVEKRPGHLELKGDYSKEIKSYLAGLGF